MWLKKSLSFVRKLLFFGATSFFLGCSFFNRYDEMEFRRDYDIEMAYFIWEKEGEGRSIPYFRSNFPASLYYALRGKDDSALYYFNKSSSDRKEEEIEKILKRIYVSPHIHSFSFDEKFKYVMEGIEMARKKRMKGLVVDGFLMLTFLTNHYGPDISFVDSAFKYSKTHYDYQKIKGILDYITPKVEDYGKYVELYFKVTKKIEKTRPKCKKGICD